MAPFDQLSLQTLGVNKDEGSIPKMVITGAKARLIGVRTKAGQQGVELHGDEGTIIEIEGATEIQPAVVRILSMTKSESGNSLIVGVQQDRKLLNISDLASVTKDLKPGDVIECMPSKVYGNSVTLEGDSF